MKRNLLLSAVSALLLCAAVMPASASDCPGFLPPNDLKIPVGSAQDKGMIEAQFNEVLTTLEKIYKPLIAAQPCSATSSPWRERVKALVAGSAKTCLRHLRLA